jgi:hypothetical protein
MHVRVEESWEEEGVGLLPSPLKKAVPWRLEWLKESYPPRSFSSLAFGHLHFIIYLQGHGRYHRTNGSSDVTAIGGYFGIFLL